MNCSWSWAVACFLSRGLLYVLHRFECHFIKVWIHNWSTFPSFFCCRRQFAIESNNYISEGHPHAVLWTAYCCNNIFFFTVNFCIWVCWITAGIMLCKQLASVDFGTSYQIAAVHILTLLTLAMRACWIHCSSGRASDSSMSFISSSEVVIMKI